MGPLLEIVIIHHRQPDKCIQTCLAFLAQGIPLHLTVVDNGSSPADRSRITSAIPSATVVPLGANRGFGPAANVGLRRWLDHPGGDWAVVAPHDARPQPGSLDRLFEVAATVSRAGLACAEYGDDTRPIVDPYLGGMVVPLAGAGPWVSTAHPHGTMLALRRECLQEVGLFDERYFAYVEEADLAMRAAAAGWEAGMVVGATVANPGTNVTRPVVEYLQTRNTLLLVRDHFGAYHGFIRICIGVLSTLYQTARPSRRAPWFDARSRWLAIRDRLCHRYGPPPAHLLAIPQNP
ncbi:MAG TPA: glycosyltransferase [Acidimicrobiales bacterium]|nr:glycosyltransferase [Acidimicrobiales bacterium]